MCLAAHTLRVAATGGVTMGLFGFGRGPNIEKLTKKLTNAYAQTQDRHQVMRQLAEIGSDESLYGLIQRFTYKAEASILDHDEKEAAYHLLVDAGPAAVPPIERFVNFSDAVYWPLKALKEIVGTEHAVGVLLAALDSADSLDQRVNERKTQLVSNLRDFPHPRVEERLVSLCEDLDEDVRIMAADGLLTYGPESALSPIARRLLDEEESPRVKTVILEQLIELGWSLAPWRAQLDEMDDLPVPYELTHDGRIHRG